VTGVTNGTVLILAEHASGQLAESVPDLIAAALPAASSLGGHVEVAVLGSRPLAAQLATTVPATVTVLSMVHPAVGSYLPQAYEEALLALLEQRSPRLLLLSAGTAGLDLTGALSVRWDAPAVTGVTALAVEGGAVVTTAQILGGKVLADVELGGERGIITAIAGALGAGLGVTTGTAHGGADADNGAADVVDVAAPPALDALAMSVTGQVEAVQADIDLAAAPVLVSVGRGIESADNLDLVQELADALGAPLSASRPVVDAGWLPRSRQVGKSGRTVRPKVYLAFGISGAPEHLEGIRNAELIIACNTDARAPIFGVAHYGTTADLFDLVPELTEQFRSR